MTGPDFHVPQLGGIVLCGGRSSRMGRDKATLRFADKTFLERVVETMATVVVPPIVVVAAAEQELPPLEGVEIVRDESPFQGPLAGIALGLESLANGSDWAYVSSCDAPLLKPAWISKLFRSGRGAEIIVAQSDAGQTHPLSAIYHTNVAKTARSLLAANRYRPVFLFESHTTTLVPETELREVDPNLDTLRNVNTPDEFDELCKLLAQGVTG